MSNEQHGRELYDFWNPKPADDHAVAGVSWEPDYWRKQAAAGASSPEAGEPAKHVTRMSDSSLYDEVCVNCGATDANGMAKLNGPCPTAPPTPEAGEPRCVTCGYSDSRHSLKSHTCSTGFIPPTPTPSRAKELFLPWKYLKFGAGPRKKYTAKQCIDFANFANSAPSAKPKCKCGHDEPTHRVIIDNHGTESGFCYACPDKCDRFDPVATKRVYRSSGSQRGQDASYGSNPAEARDGLSLPEQATPAPSPRPEAQYTLKPELSMTVNLKEAISVPAESGAPTPTPSREAGCEDCRPEHLVCGCACHESEAAPSREAPEQLVIDICRELYDRFVMGGWQPQDAYPQIRAMLAGKR